MVLTDNKLDKLIEDVNEHLEKIEQYILEHKDFAQNYWHCFVDEFTYHEDIIKQNISSHLLEDGTISDYAYEYITDAICSGDVELLEKVQGLPESDQMVEIASIPLGEQEEQLPNELVKRIEQLSDEQFETFTRNIDWYMNSRNKDLAYIDFGYGTTVSLYANVNELIELYNEVD